MKRLNILVGSMGVVALGAAVIVLAPSIRGQERVRVERDSPDARERNLERQVRMTVLPDRGSQIGVSIRDVEQADLATQKLSSAQGVVVENVRGAGPAEKAGVKTGDVVIEFDGDRVRSVRQLSRLVKETPSGREVSLIVMREGERMALKVTPAGEDGPAIALPEIAEHMAPFNFRVPGIDIPDFDVEIRAGSRLGVMVSDLTEQLAGHFGVKDGVLVNEVVADSPAAAAGIKAGDVITSVGGKAVESAGDIRRSVGQAEGDEVTVGIVRDRKEQSVTVKVEREERRQRTRRIMM